MSVTAGDPHLSPNPAKGNSEPVPPWSGLLSTLGEKLPPRMDEPPLSSGVSRRHPGWGFAERKVADAASAADPVEVPAAGTGQCYPGVSCRA